MHACLGHGQCPPLIFLVSVSRDEELAPCCIALTRAFYSLHFFITGVMHAYIHVRVGYGSLVKVALLVNFVKKLEKATRTDARPARASFRRSSVRVWRWCKCTCSRMVIGLTWKCDLERLAWKYASNICQLNVM